jgi:hypothetical protein
MRNQNQIPTFYITAEKEKLKKKLNMQSRKPEEEYWCVRRQNRRQDRPSSPSTLSLCRSAFMIFFCSQQHIYMGKQGFTNLPKYPLKGKMVISTDIYFYI